MSQSLLHQGIQCDMTRSLQRNMDCRNPFFIRAFNATARLRRQRLVPVIGCRNPFFIRAFNATAVQEYGILGRDPSNVAIPSSSGHSMRP
jgi:hypothetical protein